MQNYYKGAVFSMNTEQGDERLFTVVENAKINENAYILAVPVEKKGEKVIPHPERVVALRTYEDETLAIETDEEIIAQIVDCIIPPQN